MDGPKARGIWKLWNMEHSGFWGKKGGHRIWEGRSRAVRVRDECKKTC